MEENSEISNKVLNDKCVTTENIISNDLGSESGWLISLTVVTCLSD